MTTYTHSLIKHGGGRLYTKYYQNIVAGDLLLKQNYRNIMQLPRIVSIIINTTGKNYVNEKKDILSTCAVLYLLSGQKPVLTYARKSIASFKIREDQILGCMLSLRNKKMSLFLDKLGFVVFPRIREWSKVYSIDKWRDQTMRSSALLSMSMNRRSRYSGSTLGLRNLMIFPELESQFPLVDSCKGIHCTFVISNPCQSPCGLLLSGLQLPPH